MDYYLTNPMIEGVYETQVDPEFRGVVTSGTQCRLKNKNINLENEIELTDLALDTKLESERLFHSNIF